jgi:RecJ-like exonuclease
LSTRISEKHQKSLVVIYEKVGNRMKVSSRNQAKNINAGKVMQKAAGEVGGSGGGHEAAAGATVPTDEWDKFKEIVVKLANR